MIEDLESNVEKLEIMFSALKEERENKSDLDEKLR